MDEVYTSPAARRRGRRRVGLLATTLFALILFAACEGAIYADIDQVRGGAGQPVLARSALLQGAARQNSAAMCSAGLATPSSDPAADYDLETIAGADELVGSAVLDPGIVDSQERNNAATSAIWSTWASAPTLTDARWDDLGVGEVECGDGRLYLTAALTERPFMPSSGRYSSVQYPLAQIQTILGLQYGTAINYLGQNVNLQLDLYLPPTTGDDRPLVILVHGGGFQNGNRGQLATAAREYARRGYAAASISYRLNPTLGSNPDPAVYLQTASNAIDDGMESVRWLRANAAIYEIDPDRIAMIGSSAGGGIALGVGVVEDLTPGGPLAATSPRIQAAVSTGATLALGLPLITFTDDDSPMLLFHYESDTVTDATAADAQATCDALRNVGGTCDVEIQPGAGHTIGIGPAGTAWTNDIGPYLWQHLDLN